jgi:hypothetical protein
VETETPPCPVEIGQLVNVQIDARVSIEGYSIQANDTSFLHNIEFTSDEWSTSAKPAIVINTVFDAHSSCHKILVVSLGCGTPATGTKFVTVAVAPSPHALKHQVVIQPEWPKSQTYCYVFPHAYWFYCLPGQVSVISNCKFTESLSRMLGTCIHMLDDRFRRCRTSAQDIPCATGPWKYNRRY